MKSQKLLQILEVVVLQCYLTREGKKTPKKVKVAKLELHGIADASREVYGAAIYLRYLYTSLQLSSKFLCSKSL